MLSPLAAAVEAVSLGGGELLSLRREGAYMPRRRDDGGVCSEAPNKRGVMAASICRSVIENK
jgi:hypothetical protein